MSEETPSASCAPEEQLEAIHAMLSAGHHGIRVERHSLGLWGIAGALLILVTPRLINGARFPTRWQGATVELVFLASVLGLVAFLDFRLTRRVRRRQGECLPFVQRQIGKVWLLLMGLGLAATFGAHLYGGGGMVYLLWMLLVGIGLFTHGLFSPQSLGWFGGVIIVLSAGALALQLPVDGTRWLAVFVLGLGGPILGLLLGRLEVWAAPVRLLCLLGWLALVTGATFATYRIGRAHDVPGAPSISLGEYRRQEGSASEQIVSLPRGTVVPIRIALQGDAFVQPAVISVPLELTKALELVLVDGKLDGRYRVEDGKWKYYGYDLSVPKAKVHAELTRADGFSLQYMAELAIAR